MEGFVITLVVLGIILVSVAFLRGFDKVAGRGPKQVTDGINRACDATPGQYRAACPHCAELILPVAKICPRLSCEITDWPYTLPTTAIG